MRKHILGMYIETPGRFDGDVPCKKGDKVDAAGRGRCLARPAAMLPNTENFGGAASPRSTSFATFAALGCTGRAAAAVQGWAGPGQQENSSPLPCVRARLWAMVDRPAASPFLRSPLFYNKKNGKADSVCGQPALWNL